MALFTRKKIRNIYLKLIRQTGTPESVARGVAVGFFIGFLIPIGFQMVIASGLAYILKAKQIPALACTWVTNHVTVIFIYPVQCYFGMLLMGGSRSFAEVNELFKNFLHEHTWKAFTDLGMEIIVPFLLGGLIFGIVTGVISYFTSLGMIVSYRKRVEKKMRKRLADKAEWHAARKAEQAGNTEQ